MRVFLSFHIPEEIASTIIDSLAKTPGLDLYPKDTFHATIKFIGEVGGKELESLTRSAKAVASKYKSPIKLEFKDYFIEDNRLRASLKADVLLLQLQAEVCSASHQIVDKVKSQPYLPHITLGRVTPEFKVDSLSKLDLDISLDKFVLFETIPHDGTEPRYEAREEFKLSGAYTPSKEYTSVVLPTRPQPDTIIAIFILKHFGAEHFPGIGSASYESFAHLPEGESEESLMAKGKILLDVGGGIFDHHTKHKQTTASNLVSEYLGVKDNPALAKMLQFAERDDFFGKGIISTDPLDRAFGLSGLIASLNKKHVNDPSIVINAVIPLLDAFVHEEEKRAFEMPKELEEKLSSGKADAFMVRQRGKKLKCIIIETDNTSMAGFLRSKIGGGYDVVVIRLPSGHTNILTRPLQRVDLRSLVVLVRIQECESKNKDLPYEPREISVSGSIPEVPEWYYDTATNSLLNGGPNPQNIKATSIDPFEFKKILEVGISEQLWSPQR